MSGTRITLRRIIKGGENLTHRLGNFSLDSCNISGVSRIALEHDLAVGQVAKIDGLKEICKHAGSAGSAEIESCSYRPKVICNALLEKNTRVRVVLG